MVTNEEIYVMPSFPTLSAPDVAGLCEVLSEEPNGQDMP